MENKDANYWNQKGEDDYRADNFREAIECFVKAVNLKRDYHIAWHNWGCALASLATIEQDEDLFRESFEKFDNAIHWQKDYYIAFIYWGQALLHLAIMKQEKSLFEESIKKSSEAIRLQSNEGDPFNNWGCALYYLARIQQDESLLKESFEKFDKAIQLNKNSETYNNWGLSLFELAKIKQDETLFRESCEKFAESAKIEPDRAPIFHNWGIVLFHLAGLRDDKPLLQEACMKFEESVRLESNATAFRYWGVAVAHFADFKGYDIFFKESFEKLYKESDCLRKINIDVLEILTIFSNACIKKKLKLEVFLPLLNYDTYDGLFFKTATISEKNKEKLERYKEVYMLSIFIISLLHVHHIKHVDIEAEKLVAHYAKKLVAQKMLFDDSRFRLSSINYANDPTEGKILLNYLLGKDNQTETLDTGYRAFVGCFTFNHDSLNQFRLYGKEADKECTGVAIVFRDSFFSNKAEMAMKSEKEKENVSLEEKKHALFRCIYIDPVTRRVETVGHKEDYLLYREDNDNQEKINKYKDYINNIVDNVKCKMEELQKIVKSLDSQIIEQLLINLRYLTKHIAFKEEQECRILKIYDIIKDKDKIKRSEDYKQMYINNLNISNHVEKIYFGPKASGIELFQDMQKHNKLNISCERSKNPFA